MAAFWIVVLQLETPEGLSRLRDEADTAQAAWVANNPDAKLEDNIAEFVAGASLPLMVSTIQESLRYASSAMSIRDVQEPLEFAGYQFDKGEQVVCNTRVVHLDEEIHQDGYKFIPERYLDGRKFVKDGRPVPNHSSPFGMGVSKCEGRRVYKWKMLCIDLISL
jgi:cytochrome P450